MKFPTASCVLLALVIWTAAAAAQSPSLTHSTPGALRPGRIADLTLHGANLIGATNLWTSFPAEVISSLATNAATARFQVQIPDHVPVGIYAARVASVRGVSGPLLLLVDDLPSVPDAGTNTTALTNAQRILPPVAVDGVTAALQYKFYRFTAKKGERLAVEAVAQRLGSKLDPVVRLLDLKGRELAFSDDEPGLAADSRFAHTFAAGGDYVLEVRDINFAGGSDYRFRLRVGDFPLANLPFPAGVQAGATATLTFAGPQVDRLAPVTVTAPRDATRLPVAARFAGGKSSALVAALVSEVAEVVEAEPNELPETATPFTIPAALNGRFLQPRERDHWKFSAAQGQRVVFTAQTRSIASASELMLQIRDSAGKVLVNSAVNDASEGAVTNTIPAAGDYFLVVEELIRRGGPQHVYRITADRAEAAFTLASEVEKLEVATGGTASLKINATRRNFTGPITLAVEGLGAGATWQENVIAAKTNSTTLKITLPASATPGTLARLRVTGTGQVGEPALVTVATTTEALIKLFPQMPFPPRELGDWITLGVTAPASPAAK